MTYEPNKLFRLQVAFGHGVSTAIGSKLKQPFPSPLYHTPDTEISTLRIPCVHYGIIYRLIKTQNPGLSMYYQGLGRITDFSYVTSSLLTISWIQADNVDTGKRITQRHLSG